jgi:hypothetical protein
MVGSCGARPQWSITYGRSRLSAESKKHAMSYHYTGELYYEYPTCVCGLQDFRHNDDGTIPPKPERTQRIGGPLSNEVVWLPAEPGCPGFCLRVPMDLEAFLAEARRIL